MLLRRNEDLATKYSRAAGIGRRFGAYLVLAATIVLFGTSVEAQKKSNDKSKVGPVTDVDSTVPKKQPWVKFAITWSYMTDQDLGRIITVLALQKYKIVGIKLQRPDRGGRLECVISVHTQDSGFARDLLRTNRQIGLPISSLKPSLAEAKVAAKKAPLIPAGMKRVSISVNNASIREVIDTIAKTVQANIILAPEVQGNLTMRLKDIPWRSALEAAVNTLNFVLVEANSGILVVTQRNAKISHGAR